MKRHWEHADFVLVSQYLAPEAEHYPNGIGYGVQQGYCRKCGGDMQRFVERYMLGGSVVWGPLRHYNSHKRSRTAITLTPV